MASIRARGALLTALSAASLAACAAFGSAGDDAAEGRDAGVGAAVAPGGEAAVAPGGDATTGQGPPCNLGAFAQEHQLYADFEADPDGGFAKLGPAAWMVTQTNGANARLEACGHDRKGQCLHATIPAGATAAAAELSAGVDFTATPRRTVLCARVFFEADLSALSGGRWMSFFGFATDRSATTHAAIRHAGGATGAWLLEAQATRDLTKSDAYADNLGVAFFERWHVLTVTTDWSGDSRRVTLRIDDGAPEGGTPQADLALAPSVRAAVHVGLRASPNGFPAATAWIDDFAIGWE